MHASLETRRANKYKFARDNITSQKYTARRHYLQYCLVLPKHYLVHKFRQLTEKTHRKCYVINFSDEAVALLVEDLSRDMPKLAEFLNKSFNGGTDVEPALREAAHIINGNDFRESDIVLISDFEMPPLSKDLKEQIRVMKRRKTSFFALSFGNQPEMEYLNLCDRYWEM